MALSRRMCSQLHRQPFPSRSNYPSSCGFRALRSYRPSPVSRRVEDQAPFTHDNEVHAEFREPIKPRQPGQTYWSYVAQRVKETPTMWSPIPLWGGAAVLVLSAFYKAQRGANQDREGNARGVRAEGPWQVKVLGALPLRSISRLYGVLNSYELPVWFRVPGYHLYIKLFGVNLEEAEVQDLKEYKSLQEFFLRSLKDGVRPISDDVLVSPADGKVVNFGTIEERRVASVKGMSYSVDALLAGQGSSHSSDQSPSPNLRKRRSPDESNVSDAHFANINDVPYSIGELMGHAQNAPHLVPKDASVSADEQATSSEEVSPGSRKRIGRWLARKLGRDAKVAKSVGKGDMENAAAKAKSLVTNEKEVGDELARVPRPGNRMFFAVVYLAPGDYHRFHSPVNWVVERRRHFAGELFSVSPWMVGKLADLFVLNERVALLGRWRHGFFSMTPVGATNVGSIIIHFDSQLRTNSPSRPFSKGTFNEAVYTGASQIWGGQPVEKGEEVGGFSLGSTIVMVFEAPENFEFSVEKDQKIKYGESMGRVSKSKPINE